MKIFNNEIAKISEIEDYAKSLSKKAIIHIGDVLNVE